MAKPKARKPKACTHCYHSPGEGYGNWSITFSGTPQERICCHCGAGEWAEHGPHHPAKKAPPAVVPYVVYNNKGPGTTTTTWTPCESCQRGGTCNCVNPLNTVTS